MVLKINDVAVIKNPSSFQVTTMDLDNADSTKRSANGELIRDRVAVKKKIEVGWAVLTTAQISSILQSMDDVFFTVYYLDPFEGGYITKTFYVGDRPAGIAHEVGGETQWKDLKVSLIEK